MRQPRRPRHEWRHLNTGTRTASHGPQAAPINNSLRSVFDAQDKRQIIMRSAAAPAGARPWPSRAAQASSTGTFSTMMRKANAAEAAKATHVAK